MSRYSINDRIKFDMAVEKARLVKEAEREHGRRKGVVAKSVRLSGGGNPPWVTRFARKGGRRRGG